MQTSAPLRFAGDVSIDKVKIVTPAGFFQDVGNQVINIQLFEDLFSPFTTGNMVIKESLDLVNLFPFVGEEYLELEISTPTIEIPIKNRYYIYKLTERELLGDRSVVYQIHFISIEALVDMNKKISKGFSGSISDTVKTFLEDKTVGMQTEKKVFIEPTSNNIKYVSNYWSPIENIKFLTERAINQNKIPNYVFFENRDGYYFMSLDALYNAQPFQEFIYDRYVRDDRALAGSIKNINEEYKRISDVSMPVVFDYMDRLQGGMLSSRVVSYDLTKKTYNSKVYTVKDNFDKQKHLNKYSINSDKTIFRSNAFIITLPKYYGNFTNFGDTTNYNSVQERVSLMRLAEANKIEITVPGRTDYTVGMKVNVKFNRIEPIKKEEDATDKMFSGNYLIAAINHYIDREKHECHMELVKESSMMDMNRNK